jgi:threonine synthase
LRYVSTRGAPGASRFAEILLEGLAPDGGLYVPASYPALDRSTLDSWRGLSYADLAFEIVSRFVDDIPAADLRVILSNTYTAETFGDARIVPLERIEGDMWLQHLSNGPTLAFKDVAMQLLGRLFEYELARRGTTLNVLGATSGDTGSAAEHALKGKRGIAVFMLSPHGRMSPFQQAQMYSLLDANIHNLAIEGVFDDCQDIVKAVSADLDFKRTQRIGTVNSINWARLLAQVVYYVSAWLQATRPAAAGAPLPEVSFAVPSGNFGNVCAGHVARRMGLPIRQLVVATNENDVLDEFFRSGTYRVRAGHETHATSSPSMDISKASNFERFVFDLVDRDAGRLRTLFVDGVGRSGRFALKPDELARVPRFGFVSGRSTHADRIATIRALAESTGRVIDPHTADGWKVGREHAEPGVPMIVLETALPAKFADAIVEATGRTPPRPAAFEGLESRPRRCTVLPRDAHAVQRYIAAHAT